MYNFASLFFLASKIFDSAISSDFPFCLMSILLESRQSIEEVDDFPYFSAGSKISAKLSSHKTRI